jgi:hypothetical protein
MEFLNWVEMSSVPGSEAASLTLMRISNTYLMGSEYSMADVHLFVVSNWASWVNFDLSSYRAVLAFRERVRARPAVIASLRPRVFIRGQRLSRIDDALQLPNRGTTRRTQVEHIESASPPMSGHRADITGCPRCAKSGRALTSIIHIKQENL